MPLLYKLYVRGGQSDVCNTQESADTSPTNGYAKATYAVYHTFGKSTHALRLRHSNWLDGTHGVRSLPNYSEADV